MIGMKNDMILAHQIDFSSRFSMLHVVGLGEGAKDGALDVAMDGAAVGKDVSVGAGVTVGGVVLVATAGAIDEGLLLDAPQG
ncbi:unnamed protein product [Cylindrotheca closterium]|uniref:Uncharacterized protein n=1 Tax=Cylindrotheca closterium TaxID=2856 RepID=A0AAD2CMD5_9STRA|nr:unnamed protein product [Cylindrotheca closterium]